MFSKYVECVPMKDQLASTNITSQLCSIKTLVFYYVEGASPELLNKIILHYNI